MFSSRIEGRMVGITFTNHFSQANNCRLRAVAMVKEYAVTKLDFITQKIACLVVADTVPWFSLIRPALQVIKREAGRFRFHQPVVHRQHRGLGVGNRLLVPKLELQFICFFLTSVKVNAGLESVCFTNVARRASSIANHRAQRDRHFSQTC